MLANDELKELCGLQVIDDFYADPIQARSLALSLPWPDSNAKQAFAGRQTVQSIAFRPIIDKISGLVGSKISVDTENNLFGQFRVATKNCLGETKVHFDSVPWSLVVYLSQVEKPLEGTSFYRHRRTGLLNPHAVDLGTDDVVSEIIRPDTHNLSAWEKVASVPYKFNRALLFRGDSIFHAGGPAFGVDLESGRMTQHFFFDVEAS